MADRWEFKSGTIEIKVKRANLEYIRYTSKKALAANLFQLATGFQYYDMFANDYVCDRHYDQAADTTDGVNLLFKELCNDEATFDSLYQGSLR